MSTQVRVKTYFLILEKLLTDSYPSFREVKEFLCDEGVELGDRSLQRHFEAIKLELKQEIQYDRKRKGYFINRDESHNTNKLINLLELTRTAEIITESLVDGKNILEFLQFDKAGELKGIDNLSSIIYGIKHCRKISFKHENFETGLITDYIINPHALKQFRHRWYVIGWVPTQSVIRKFGIERITNLKVSAAGFRKSPIIYPASMFENVIGLTNTDKEPQRIELLFTPMQGKYIKSLPLHKTQCITNETKDGITVEYYLATNYEFIQELLMLGSEVKILSPSSLVREVKKRLRDTLAQYSKK